MSNRSQRFNSAARLLCNKIVTLRSLHGLSQKDLADLLKIDPAQLCKLETGKHLPHVKFLERIEDTLNLPPQSLVSIRNQISMDSCYDDGVHFDNPADRFEPTCERELLTIPNDELAKLAEKIAPLADEYATELMKRNLPSFCLVNLGALPAVTERDGINYAEGLRDLVGDYTATFAALLPRLEQLNFRFIPLPTLPPCIRPNGTKKLRKALALHDRRYDCPVILVNQEAQPHEQLYEITYEIGSFLRYQRKLTISRLRKKEEWEFCRAFATTLLVPSIVIRDIVDELNVPRRKWTLPLIDNLAFRFGVSSMVMLYRLLSIGRIDPQLFKVYIDQLSKPHVCDDEKAFPPRPPIKFGTWLEALKLRNAIR